MLDIGSWEFLIVIAVALVVIGPKDLPALIRNVSTWIRRAKDLARDFQSGLEDMARETDLEKIKEDLTADLDTSGLVSSLKDDIEQTIDPEGLRRAVAWNENDEYGIDAANTIEVDVSGVDAPEAAEIETGRVGSGPVVLADEDENYTIADPETVEGGDETVVTENSEVAEDDAKQAEPGA